MAEFFERICRRLVMAFCCLPILAHTTPLKITFSTPTLSGITAQIAFDFIDGGTPANTITLTQFTTDGMLGSSSIAGNVTGSLPGPVKLSDTSFFSEYLTDITLGTGFSFVFDSTGGGPDLGSLPDAFSVFLLDPITGLSLFATDDSTGADSFLRVDLVSDVGAVAKFQDRDGKVLVSVAPVTEIDQPASALLLIVGLITLSNVRRRSNRRLFP